MHSENLLNNNFMPDAKNIDINAETDISYILMYLLIFIIHFILYIIIVILLFMHINFS